MSILLAILIPFLFVALLRIFRQPIRQWVYNLRAKLRVRSLRVAIGEADDNKEKTGRKTIVVFNQHSGHFEPIEKKVLKTVAGASKNKSNKALTDGRRWFMSRTKKKKALITTERVKQIEKKSLYVTN
jgi:hypothetical protein